MTISKQNGEGLHCRRGQYSRGKSNLGFSISNSLQKQKNKKEVGVQGPKKEEREASLLDTFSVFHNTSIRRHLYLHPVTTGKYIEIHILKNIILSRSWKLTVKMVSDPISTLICSALIKGNKLDFPRMQQFQQRSIFHFVI